jgi:hypothetical protein
MKIISVLAFALIRSNWQMQVNVDLALMGIDR